MASSEIFRIVGSVLLEDDDFKKKLKNVVSEAKTASSSIGDALQSVGSGIQKAGDFLTGVGKQITTYVTAPVIGLGVATAKTALDFLQLKENTRTAFKVLLGSAEEAEKMLQDLYTFAKTTPFAYDTYLQAGKQLVAMGVAAKDTIPYLEGITNAAIATGAGQAGIDTLSTAIGRMSSKGKIQLEELNRMIEMGVPAVKILGNAYGKTEMQIYDMMKKGELLTDDALPKLIDGMNNGTNGVNGMTAAYGGLAMEMKGTLAGAFDSLRSKFRNMSIEMWDAENAYPRIITLVQNFTKVLEALPKVFKGISDAAAAALDKLNTKLQELADYISKADPKQLQQIGDTILKLAVAGPILLTLGKTISTVGKAVSGLGSMLSAVAEVGGLGAVVTAAAPVLAVIAGIVAALAVLTHVFGGPLEFLQKLKDMFDTTVAVAKNFLNALGTFDKLDNIKEKFAGLWGAVGKLGDFFTMLGAIIAGLVGGAFALLLDFWVSMLEFYSPIIDGLTQIIELLAWFGTTVMDLFKSAIPEVQRFSDEVSESTQKAVGSFMDLEEEATKSLNALNWSGKEVTADMAENINGTFQKMTDSILKSIDEQKNGVVDTLNEMFLKSSEITEEEKQNIMQNATISFEEKAKITQEGNEKIKSIMQTAANENRQLTEEENTEINRIKTEMMNTAVVIMSESEAEQNAIFERLKINASNLSAEQAVEVVQNAIKQKDETVAAAEEEYNKRLTAASMLKSQGTEEAIQAADAIIAEATRQRDDTVLMAEETHQKIIEEAQLQAGEHVNAVNWETGEVYSKWDMFWADTGNKWNEFSTNISESFSESARQKEEAARQSDEKIAEDWNTFTAEMGILWNDFKTKTGETWENIKNTLSTKSNEAKIKAEENFNNLKNSVVDKWSDIKNKASEKWNEIKNSMIDPIKNAKEKIDEWINKIKDTFNNFKAKIKMPHFSVSNASLNPLDWINNGFPKINVDWYKKGAILKSSTAFGINPKGNLMVGGEAEKEAIAPISELQKYVQNAVNQSNAELNNLLSGILNILNLYLPQTVNTNLVLDTGVLVGSISPNLDKQLGISQKLKERGN